jgi:hypothetical protein
VDKTQDVEQCVDVLVCFCCYNKVPEPGYLEQKRDLLSSQFWRSKNMVLAIHLASGEGHMVEGQWAKERSHGERLMEVPGSLYNSPHPGTE